MQILSPIISLCDAHVHPVASVSAIRSVQYCPYQPNFIAAGSYGGQVKVWSTNSYRAPVISLKNGDVGWIYDVEWDPTGRGLLLAGSDSPGVL